MSAPVGELRLHLAARKSLALPVRVVAKLNRQLGQRTRTPFAEGGIKRRELAGENGLRPAIECDVVPCEQQRVIGFTETCEHGPSHGSTGEIEGARCFARGEFSKVACARFHDAERAREMRHRELYEIPACVAFDAGAQDFVAARDFVQTALHRRDLQRTRDPPAQLDVVSREARRDLIENPERLL